MPANSPILISKSLTGILNGGSPFVPEGLTNELKQGLWIDEFRFTMTTERVDAGTWYGPSPDALRVAIRIGNTELTKGLIPAALLCRPRDWLSETPSILCNFIWRLPKRLYLPENGNINVRVQQQDDFYAANPLKMSVDVAVVARPTLDKPKFVDVPYASFYQGSLVTSGTVADRSGENDLRNPFRELLRVVRFSATNWGTMHGGGNLSDPTVGAFSVKEVRTLDAVGMCGANTIQLYDQDGDFGVRDVTPLGAFAALSDRSWKVDARLKSNAHFIADLSTTLSSGSVATRQAIGMIGYRTIPLSALGVES